jgi:hypothetical protein
MNGKHGLSLGAVLAIVAVIAVMAVGVGYAYTAITENSGNGYSMANIVATDEYGDKNINIPTAVYESAGELWYPDSTLKVLNGNLSISYPGNGNCTVRMWIQLDNELSWTVIDRIALFINGSSYACYRYDPMSGNPESCGPTDPIVLSKGDHAFSIDVVYREGIIADPTLYSGDKLKSTIVFIEGDTDPFNSS